MNDFTKEELQDINYALTEYGDFESARVENLVGKIQSMIESYCEHESDGYSYYKNGAKCTDFLMYACSDSPCLLKCKKCSKLFDDGRP